MEKEQGLLVDVPKKEGKRCAALYQASREGRSSEVRRSGCTGRSGISMASEKAPWVLRCKLDREPG